MNSTQRAQVQEIAAAIGAEIEKLKKVLDLEQEDFDNLSEADFDYDPGLRLTDSMETLESVIYDLESAKDALESL